MQDDRPLYRNHVFAEISPSAVGRIDLGFALGDTKATGRLMATGGFEKKDRITHRVPISSPGRDRRRGQEVAQACLRSRQVIAAAMKPARSGSRLTSGPRVPAPARVPVRRFADCRDKPKSFGVVAADRDHPG